MKEVRYTVSKYESEDGLLFATKSLCEEHEKEMEANKIMSRVKTKAVNGVEWYLISTQSEFEAWLAKDTNNKWLFDCIDRHSFVPGWYCMKEKLDDSLGIYLYYPKSLPQIMESIKGEVRDKKKELSNLKKQLSIPAMKGDE